MKIRNGFSLLELVVTIGVMSIAVVGALSFFDVATRLAKTQVSLSDMQSSQRILHQEMGRMISMAGVGGLPDGLDPEVATTVGTGDYGIFPEGLALSVLNNVDPGLDFGDLTTPLPVVAGTDVLILRGVFSTPVHFLEPQVEMQLDAAGNITLTFGKDVDVGVRQDLDGLRAALTSASPRPEAIVVYDRFNPGAFAVLEYVASTSNLGATGSPTMTLGLTLGSGVHSQHYGKMVLGTALVQGAGGQQWTVPGNGLEIQLPRSVGAVGLLEEYRFFIRQEREVPNQTASRLVPTLTRARFYPGTEVLHPEGAIDIGSNLVDLQVSLAVDTAPADGQILELGQGANDDEILFNYPGDDDGLSAISSSPWANPDSQLLFVRLTTITQADRPDRDFTGAVLDLVEDHDYNQGSPSIFNSGPYTKLRKRLLQTIVEVRNLP